MTALRTSNYRAATCRLWARRCSLGNGLRESGGPRKRPARERKLLGLRRVGCAAGPPEDGIGRESRFGQVYGPDVVTGVDGDAGSCRHGTGAARARRLEAVRPRGTGRSCSTPDCPGIGEGRPPRPAFPGVML